MIGQNNAGKTTVVEALRILGLATARLRTSSMYIARPEWLSEVLPLSEKGIKISASAIDTDLEQVFFRYGDPPAIIDAFFSNSVMIKTVINSESELFVIFFHRGKCITGKNKIIDIGVPSVRVLPQIVPLTKDEIFVGKETLQRNRFSKRTSGNFRNNVLAIKADEIFQKLQNMIIQTWGSITISSIEKDTIGNNVYLNIRDGDFVTEIYYMGHGIQMWLQTLWFIVSSDLDSIIVLDEPDVYIHADLQRKLVRMLKGNYEQMIIATHSVEIISEVQPENILIINRKNTESMLADGYPVLQTAISGMGSVHNLNLSRLLNNKRYLYVEGKDMDILKVFYDKLFSKEPEPLDHFPCISTGGWGSWQAQKEHALKLLNEIPDLKIYFFYDSDYHQIDEIDKREREAMSSNIRIHIWERKELENYVIVDSAIARFICRKKQSLEYTTICSEIRSMIENTLNEKKEDVIGKIGDERTRKEKGREPSIFFSEARIEINNLWTGFDNKVKLVPGAEIISQLSQRCKEQYDVSFSAQQIASQMLRTEIDNEVKTYLNRIRESK